MRKLPAVAALLAIGGLAGAAAWPPGASSDWNVQELRTPAGSNSAQPQLSSSERALILSWIERADSRATLKFAERTAAGWSEPRDVASGDDWFVNWADVPSVVRLADGSLTAHWLQKSGPGTYAYDVRLSYSRDDGRTWSPSFTPHHDGTKTEHGFASLFQLPGAGLGLVWLDGRAMTSSPHATNTAGHGGAMSVRFAAFDRAWKQTSEMPVDVQVCECCPTSAAVTSDGPIVAFRDRTSDEVRDIHVSRFEDGRWTPSKAVAAEGWQIAACPVNGPMVSARGRDVAIAWFSGKSDQGRALVAFSGDAGRTFGTPIRLDDHAALGRVDVELLPDGSAVATWIEFEGGRARFRARGVARSGARTDAVTVSGLDATRASGYPRIGRRGDELVFAWTENASGRLQVKTAVAVRSGSGVAAR